MNNFRKRRSYFTMCESVGKSQFPSCFDFCESLVIWVPARKLHTQFGYINTRILTGLVHFHKTTTGSSGFDLGLAKIPRYPTR